MCVSFECVDAAAAGGGATGVLVVPYSVEVGADAASAECGDSVGGLILCVVGGA